VSLGGLTVFCLGSAFFVLGEWAVQQASWLAVIWDMGYACAQYRGSPARLPPVHPTLRAQQPAHALRLLSSCSFETTAQSIAWALYEIASNPDVQAKVSVSPHSTLQCGAVQVDLCMWCSVLRCSACVRLHGRHAAGLHEGRSYTCACLYPTC